MNIQRKLAKTGTLAGLAAVLSGCVTGNPQADALGNFLGSMLIADAGKSQTTVVVNNGSPEQNYPEQNSNRYNQGPVEATRPLGRTKYSYPFLQYSGSGNITEPKNFLHKRSVISLSESEVVYFGTSWSAGKDFPWSKIDTSTRFFAYDQNDKLIYSENEDMMDNVGGSRVRWVGLDREILSKAGNQIKVGFFVRNSRMREKNEWDWHAQNDIYIVPIVP